MQAHNIHAQPIFQTEFAGFSVTHNPYTANKIAVASAQHFGIIGNGALNILNLNGDAKNEHKVRTFKTQDGLFDCAWSECNPHQIVGAAGDGSIKLWDERTPDALPITAWNAHAHEACCVEWCAKDGFKDRFLSCSWDGTVKVWNVASPVPLASFRLSTTHQVYMSTWHPHHGYTIATALADHRCLLLDTRTPNDHRDVLRHANEVTCVDWNKYRSEILVTGDVCGNLSIWDVRMSHGPMRTVAGHLYTIRNVKWSPFSDSLFASTGYDMSVALWDLEESGRTNIPLVARGNSHTEFSIGLEWSLTTPSMLLSCGWDRQVLRWSVN